MGKRAFFLIALCFIIIQAAAADDAAPYYRQPAISPDGAMVAFVYAGDIYVVPADGGTARLLAGHEAYDSSPRFSPDGRWLAFTSERTGDGDVYLISLGDGSLRRLTQHSSADLVECWSPDSAWVYFSSSRRGIRFNADIFKVSVDGGNPVIICGDGFEEEYNASVSPDGRTIAFNSNDGVRQWWRRGPVVADATEIWLKSNNPSATDYRQFTRFRGKDSWPMWAPDGSGLYFVSLEGGDENLWFQDLDGRRRQVTYFKGGRVLWPDIAAREGSIVFERDFGIWLLRRNAEPSRLEIKLLADEKKNPVELRTFTGGAGEYALSPDGKKVAFIVHGEVFAAPAEKGDDEPTFNAFRVTSTAAREQGPVWTRIPRSCSTRPTGAGIRTSSFTISNPRRSSG